MAARLTRTGTLIVGCAFAILAGGCDSSADSGIEVPDQLGEEALGDAIDRANGSAAFPVLWLGPSYRGHEVTEVQASGGRGGLSYGTCEIPADQMEGGCSLPYDLQEQPACRSFPVAGSPILTSLPGGAVTYPEGGGIVVISGRTYVKLFGQGARRAARQLRPLGESDRAKLPAPPARCEGRPRFPRGKNVVVSRCIPKGNSLLCNHQQVAVGKCEFKRQVLPPWRPGRRLIPGRSSASVLFQPVHC